MSSSHQKAAEFFRDLKPGDSWTAKLAEVFEELERAGKCLDEVRRAIDVADDTADSKSCAVSAIDCALDEYDRGA